MSKTTLYWICQFAGWLFIVLANAWFFQINNQLSERRIINLSLVFIAGIFITHFYRFLIVNNGWMSIPPGRQVLRILLAVPVMALLIDLVTQGLGAIILADPVFTNRFRYAAILPRFLNYSFILIVWSLIYFLYNYVENYRQAEIRNLKWQASIHETELNKLKSQLNPHFMFNAMNSIRALINENPEKAKECVTQLSNILRNTLLMGKSRVIPFEEEFKIVKDYLDLESTRLEERLTIRLDIDPESNRFMVPPLMIQTLVENGIKHGISKLPGGGTLKLQTQVDKNTLLIRIRNSGYLAGTEDSETGFGIKNTVQRLSLLYGSKAGFKIFNNGENTVITELLIPDAVAQELNNV